MQRAIDGALPIVDDRLEHYPGPPLDFSRAMLVVGRERPRSADAPTELGSLVRYLVDGYLDLRDGELSEALDWVERASRRTTRATS